ncbi:MAG TPA: DUF4062 domain-containing protein [bacterium]|nr:DUF4062 domain-containing protein [bacterium]
MAKKKTIMVSSTVYGIEELLEKIYSLLHSFDYEVWMSHKGTIPVLSKKTAFENCLDAVQNCDLFLGIITPFYGSGIDGENDVSITHMELRKAVELNKLRWLLSHDHVVFARNFLKNLGYDTSEKRKALKYKKSDVFGDLRVIDMYEEAILSQQPLRDRKGNWVQKFDRDEDAQLFTTAQFSRFQEAEEFINDNIKKKGGSK